MNQRKTDIMKIRQNETVMVMKFNIRKKVSEPKPEVYYFSSGNQFDPQLFAARLKSMIAQIQQEKGKKAPFILCIGSDRSTGDSLGPLIGHKLQEIIRASGVHPDHALLGTLTNPVHAVNLNEAWNLIQTHYSDRTIIAIDASIGKKENVGLLTLSKGPLKPGQGVSKELISVGDISITGIVGADNGMEHLLLQNVRLSMIMSMADCIVAALQQIFLAHTAPQQDNVPIIHKTLCCQESMI